MTRCVMHQMYVFIKVSQCCTYTCISGFPVDFIAVVLDFVKPNRVRSSNFFISISTKWPGVGLSCFPLTCFLIDQEQSVELFSYAPSNFRGYVIYGV